MSVKATLVRSLVRLSPFAAAFVAAIFGAGGIHAEELDATERDKAVQSLRDYQALFKERAVELDVQVSKDLLPAESDGPVRYDYKIVAANGWMFTEEEIGPVYGLQGGRSDANYTVKSVFDSRTDRGMKVYVRDDGKVTQAERRCAPTGIQRLSSDRLAQAVGWLDFWAHSRNDWLIDPADVLESSSAVRRVRAEDGQTQLSAMVVLEDIVECEMRYSDLPDVRMIAMRRMIPGRTEVTSEVRYRKNRDGFDEPHAIRETRRRIDETPPRILLIEEAVVTRFSMRSPAEPEPMPVIEIPDGLRVIDDCQDDESEGEVPVPSPESK